MFKKTKSKTLPTGAVIEAARRLYKEAPTSLERSRWKGLRKKAERMQEKGEANMTFTITQDLFDKRWIILAGVLVAGAIVLTLVLR
jgi:hypothetical protein